VVTFPGANSQIALGACAMICFATGGDASPGNVKSISPRNPEYWKPGRPFLDAIEWRIVSSLATRNMAFVADEGKAQYNYIYYRSACSSKHLEINPFAVPASFWDFATNPPPCGLTVSTRLLAAGPARTASWGPSPARGPPCARSHQFLG
jgi:hypothetical protein